MQNLEILDTRRNTTCAKAVFLTLCLLISSVLSLAAPVYPLKISANKRYLVDQKNEPFLLQGDAAWSLIVAMNESEVEQYFNNRRKKGFNTVMVNLIEHRYSKHPPLNLDDEAPFTTPGDFSTPNEKYFAHADWVIRKAAENGIQVLLFPIYLGYKGTDEGWIEELMKLGPEKCLEYGQYLGKRYKEFDNIIWVMGGDRDPRPVQEKIDLIALGIREFDRRHLFTAHGNGEPTTPEQFGSGGWLDVNTSYNCDAVHQRLLIDYISRPVMPTFLIESCYEGEHNSSETQIRRQAYWAVLGGGFGHVFGNNPLWHFNGPTLYPFEGTWQQAMDLPGSVDMMYWGRLFRSRSWFELVPDNKHEMVTAGLGEFEGDDYLAARRTPDGGTVIAYMPTSRTISVNMTEISGSQVKAWWFDPRNGEASAAGMFPASGTHKFTPPGEGDWVLVLDDAARQLPAPGSGR
ncbi:MAG: glycoside hydrolase family 140 protein [Terracidiphilus sp.]